MMTAQWRLLRRVRPTENDLWAVVSSAEVCFDQHPADGGSGPTFDIQVSFTAFLDEHGVAVRLRESDSGFVLGEWAGIGDL